MNLSKYLKKQTFLRLINILTLGHLGQPSEGHIPDETTKQAKEKAVAYEPSKDDIRFVADVMVQVTEVMEAVAGAVRSDIIAGKHDEYIKKLLTDTLNEELNNLCQK